MRARPKDNAIKKMIENKDPVSYAQTSTKMHIAVLINDARIQKNLTENELAEKLKISKDEVDYILAGVSNLTIDQLVEISLLLDLELITMWKENEN